VNATRPSSWAGKAIGALLFVSLCGSASAASVLFPEPLHFVRRVADPIAGKEMTLHEYCSGNRVITVSGSKVVIADYDKQQLTEIDQSAGTYSVTRFDEIARANAAIRRPAAPADALRTGARASSWKATPNGARAAASGRTLDTFTFDREEGGEKRHVVVGVDRRVVLSRDALEVLIGTAYPNTASVEHEAVLHAASGVTEGAADAGGGASAASPAATYALPAEQSMTWEIGGETLTMKNSIVSITAETAPDGVMTIPPGAKLVESRVTRLVRELRELDELDQAPATTPKPR
jgi:hypothetical protein